MKRVLPLLILCLLAGCAKDSRIKRQSSLNATKAATAAEEFKQANTRTKKLEVAQRYFETAPAQIKLVDEYLHGRKPTGPDKLPTPQPLPADIPEGP